MADQLHGLEWWRFQCEENEGGGEVEEWSQEKRRVVSGFPAEAKVGV